MTKDNLNFRIATLDDAEKIQQLVQEAFRAEDSRQDWTGNVELARAFTVKVEDIITTMAKPNNEFLLATEENNTPICCVGASERENSHARLFMLAVDDRYQRQGLGRQVITYAEGYCQRTWNSEVIELDALSTRPQLIRWYMRCGYQQTGETKPFPRAIFKELELPQDLCFIELEKRLDTKPID
ncbi:acyl-CoA N-acyltransferase [Penicillium taxi]|uniref:acyl-CoA N-acyltransferase n=1 Tax=Penicillium taxi TaxID=168475 RepID=UPI00254585BE|nr:acyl-CoA N-acyltransferase [Penicillium taxi]KAJ5887919.1 acyl-CoA N-acyltransferase [Penicillium taxi]